MTTGPRPIQQAATVVLARPHNSGFEIFLVRRHDNIAFMGGAHVFPGGRVDDTDLAADDPFRAAAVRELIEEAGVRVAPGALVPFANWVTPEGELRRYDTIFFLARLPEGESAAHDGSETTESLWLTPADAIAAAAAGTIALPPPTWTTLRQLAEFASLDAAWSWAARQPLVRIQPRIVDRADGSRLILLPGDAEHPRVDGFVPHATRFILQNGRWQPA